MKAAFAADVSTIEFWGLTPRELIIRIEEYWDSAKHRFREKAMLEWAGALWQRSKLSSFDDDYGRLFDVKKEKTLMTAEQMLGLVKILNAAFGGEVK